jgi:hypothetical protein
VLAFPHMMDFLADELSGLCTRRLAFFCILSGAYDRGLLGHFSSSNILPLTLGLLFAGTYQQEAVKTLVSFRYSEVRECRSEVPGVKQPERTNLTSVCAI